MISLVDLGVVKDVRVEGSRVRVEFTPTFMGCPALETMRARMEDAIRGVGSEPDVLVVLDDSWSTDRITPEGREKLSEPFAPPRLESKCPDAGPRDSGPLPLPLVRLHGHEARQPLRPDAVPLAALLRRLPPAGRAVQDHLTARQARGRRRYRDRRASPAAARIACGRARRDLLLPRLKRLRPPGRESRGRVGGRRPRGHAVEGGNSQFDVVADGALVFSKQQEGRFPRRTRSSSGSADAARAPGVASASPVFREVPVKLEGRG